MAIFGFAELRKPGNRHHKIHQPEGIYREHVVSPYENPGYILANYSTVQRRLND